MLSYSKAGRNRTLMLAADQVAAVRAAVARHRAAQLELEAKAEAKLAEMLARAGASSTRRGR